MKSTSSPSLVAAFSHQWPTGHVHIALLTTRSLLLLDCINLPSVHEQEGTGTIQLFAAAKCTKIAESYLLVHALLGELTRPWSVGVNHLPSYVQQDISYRQFKQRLIHFCLFFLTTTHNDCLLICALEILLFIYLLICLHLC